MTCEHPTVPGAAGLAPELPVAGPGSRSYAFVIDWHIRLLLALAWLLIGMLAVNGGLYLSPTGVRPTALFDLLVALPSLAIYLLYHPVVELWMRGRTPGKRLAAVRIVDARGGIPSAGAILIRNALRLIDALPAFYCVGLTSTFLTARRVRIGDLAAGTFLMVDEPVPSRSRARDADRAQSGAPDLAAIDVARQLLKRWPELDPGRRSSLARSLLKSLAPAEAAAVDALADQDLEARLAQAAAGADGSGADG